MKALSALLAILLAALPGPADARMQLEDVEIYGSERITPSQVLDKHREDLSRWLDLQSRSGKRVEAAAAKLKAEIESSVKGMAELGWVEMRAIELGRMDGATKTLVLFDVIERPHMATRFPFREEPDKSINDGSGLLEAWERYRAMAKERVHSGASGMERGKCSAFYCPEGAGGETMAELDERFREQVPAHREHLLQILRLDKDAGKRAAAVYLLSYLPEGIQVTNVIREGLLDPSRRVRDAALDVFNDIAIHHAEVPLPVHEIAKLMDYPHPQDRTRALALLLALADNDDYRAFMLGTAAPQIVKLLRQKTPSTRQMAHTVLTFMSGENFPAENTEAWEDWLWKQRKKYTNE